MKKLLLIALMLTIALSPLAAEGGESGDGERGAAGLGQVIRRNDLHQIGGYVSLGLVAATGVSGLLGFEYHSIIGYAALGSAFTSSLAGSIAYLDRIDEVWPHMLFSAVGIGAMVANAFILEKGSLEHRLSGVAATASFAAGYVSIILITR